MQSLASPLRFGLARVSARRILIEEPEIVLLSGGDISQREGGPFSAWSIAKWSRGWVLAHGIRRAAADAAAVACIAAMGNPIAWAIGEARTVEDVTVSLGWRTAVEVDGGGFRAVTVGPYDRAGVGWSTSRVAAICRATLNARDDEEADHG